MQNKVKTGLLLSGCGVFDGSEIHEAVLSLLMIDRLGGDAICIAPDMKQHHVLNHLTGEEMKEERNVLVESARIARGKIRSASEISADDLDVLVLPGGFGAAKNLCTWAVDGPDAKVNPDVLRLIQAMIKAKKPIASLCVSPVILAKVFEGSGINPTLTLGTTAAASPYDIAGMHEGISKTGAKAVEKKHDEVSIDRENRIITAPCYMMEIGIAQLYVGIEKALTELFRMAKEPETASC